MASQQSNVAYEFEKTLTHGHYHTKLQTYARDIAAAQRQREIEHSRERIKRQHYRRRSRAKVFNWINRYVVPYVVDWLFILVLGVLMATLSFIIDYLIEVLGTVHVVLSLELLADTSWVLQLFFWVGFPMLAISFSVGFVHLVSTHAIGSGIPEMKTVLRGINLMDYLSFRTLISKTVALITAVGSSLPIGKEGPFVHISSVIADLMTRLLSKYVKIFSHVFANEAHSNELLAAACAIGVSCNFAAPIGGVLFSIEVTSTYFAVRNYWRGFFGAVCGAFLFRLSAVWFKDEETITALFKTSFSIDFPFDPLELIAFALIGIVAGLSSALFVYFHRMFVLMRRKYRKHTMLLERSIFIYPALVAMVITGLTFPLGLGQFMAGELTQRQSLEQLFTNFTWWRIGDVDRIRYPDDSIQRMVLDQWANTSIFLSLAIFIFFRFVFTAIAVALPIPAGVFFPVFVIGAAFGRLLGEVMDYTFPLGINGRLISPGGYAVVGAAAMAGGVTHTISTSVIVFELTGQITHILPVMIAVLISNAIASLLQPSFYDSIILIKQLPFLPDLKLHRYYDLYAKNIMRTDLLFISYNTTYRELSHLLNTSAHASYPLVDNSESRILIGSVSRMNLWKLLDEQLKGLYDHAREIKLRQTPDSAVSTTPSRYSERKESGSPPLSLVQSVSESFNRLFSSPTHTRRTSVENIDFDSEPEASEALRELQDELLSHVVQLPSAIIDPSPFQLVEMTSLTKIHSLFSLLTLSHAYVTSLGKLVGVVTLKDVSDAIDRGKKLRDKDSGSRSSTPSNFTRETDYEMIQVIVSEPEPDNTTL